LPKTDQNKPIIPVICFGSAELDDSSIEICAVSIPAFWRFGIRILYCFSFGPDHLPLSAR
jgi:hypothetical protein